MARYFWCAFSAYSRYVSKDLRMRILDSISSSHGKNWNKDPPYQHIWHEQFDDLLSDYCSAVENIIERFLASPAGKAFALVCAKQRKHQKGLPLLDLNYLHIFENKPGISWGIGVVEEFFAPLKEISETAMLEYRLHILLYYN